MGEAVGACAPWARVERSVSTWEGGAWSWRWAMIRSILALMSFVYADWSSCWRSWAMFPRPTLRAWSSVTYVSGRVSAPRGSRTAPAGDELLDQALVAAPAGRDRHGVLAVLAEVSLHRLEAPATFDVLHVAELRVRPPLDRREADVVLVQNGLVLLEDEAVVLRDDAGEAQAADVGDAQRPVRLQVRVLLDLEVLLFVDVDVLGREWGSGGVELALFRSHATVTARAVNRGERARRRRSRRTLSALSFARKF